MNINISDTLEQHLRGLVRAELERRWLEENQEAIARHNSSVAGHSLLSDVAALLQRP